MLKLSMLTGGANACPPEDVGGVHGYRNFLAIIADLAREEATSTMKLARWRRARWPAGAIWYLPEIGNAWMIFQLPCRPTPAEHSATRIGRGFR